MRLLTVFLFVLGCGFAFGAEEAASSPWMPVVGEAVGLVIQVVGAALITLVSAAIWKLLGKLGIDKNASIDALLRTYVKQGINYADSWAEKQSKESKPAGEQKMATAIKHILGLIANSKLPAIAEDKLEDMIEAQLTFDKKNKDESTEAKVING